VSLANGVLGKITPIHDPAFPSIPLSGLFIRRCWQVRVWGFTPLLRSWSIPLSFIYRPPLAKNPKPTPLVCLTKLSLWEEGPNKCFLLYPVHMVHEQGISSAPSVVPFVWHPPPWTLAHLPPVFSSPQSRVFLFFLGVLFFF